MCVWGVGGGGVADTFEIRFLCCGESDNICDPIKPLLASQLPRNIPSVLLWGGGASTRPREVSFTPPPPSVSGSPPLGSHGTSGPPAPSRGT